MACRNGCSAERKAMEKAIEAHKEYHKKIVAQLTRERPADVNELLNPAMKKLGAFVNLNVTYFDFPIWLSRFDDKNTRGFAVNINSYRYQRDQHIADVIAELIRFRGKDSGNALLNAIENAGPELSIYPYWQFSLYPTALFPAIGINARTKAGPSRAGMPGSDAFIMFSAHMWNRDGRPGTSGDRGPGASADEMLFHEMVHATRFMRGILDTSLTVTKGYENMEEYLAVVLTNIYIAEKGKLSLRDSHDGFAELQRPRDFLNNPQGVNISPKRLLEQFEGQQRTFFNALADIPDNKAWWNACRDFRNLSAKKAA